jgi:hypothetical protein
MCISSKYLEEHALKVISVYAEGRRLGIRPHVHQHYPQHLPEKLCNMQYEILRSQRKRRFYGKFNRKPTF